MMQCTECGKIFETFEEVRIHYKETGHFSSFMETCGCPKTCSSRAEDGTCMYQSSTPLPSTEVKQT